MKKVLDESKHKWIADKVSWLVARGKTQAQAIVIANRMWEIVHGEGK